MLDSLDHPRLSHMSALRWNLVSPLGFELNLPLFHRVLEAGRRIEDQ